GPAWKDLDLAIRKAAASGVQVQLMTDAVSLKSGKTDLTGLAKVANIQVKTVKIPTWSGGVIPYARLIHSKYVVVDGTYVWVGRENWQKDYFESSRNVGIVMNSPEIATTLNQVFEQVWTSDYATSVSKLSLARERL